MFCMLGYDQGTGFHTFVRYFVSRRMLLKFVCALFWSFRIEYFRGNFYIVYFQYICFVTAILSFI